MGVFTKGFVEFHDCGVEYLIFDVVGIQDWRVKMLAQVCSPRSLPGYQALFQDLESDTMISLSLVFVRLVQSKHN